MVLHDQRDPLVYIKHVVTNHGIIMFNNDTFVLAFHIFFEKSWLLLLEGFSLWDWKMRQKFNGVCWLWRLLKQTEHNVQPAFPRTQNSLHVFLHLQEKQVILRKCLPKLSKQRFTSSLKVEFNLHILIISVAVMALSFQQKSVLTVLNWLSYRPSSVHVPMYSQI